MIWGLDVGPTSREKGTCVLLVPVFSPLWPENLSFTFGSDTDLENACASSTAEAALPYRMPVAPGDVFGCCSTGLRHVSGEGCLSEACGLSVSLTVLRVSPRQFLLWAWTLSPSTLCSFLSAFLPVLWSRWASSVFSLYWLWLECSGWCFSALDILFSTLHETRFCWQWARIVSDLDHHWVKWYSIQTERQNKSLPVWMLDHFIIVDWHIINPSLLQHLWKRLATLSRWKQKPSTDKMKEKSCQLQQLALQDTWIIGKKYSTHIG